MKTILPDRTTHPRTTTEREIMASNFGEALASFLSTVGSAVNELVESTKSSSVTDTVHPLAARTTTQVAPAHTRTATQTRTRATTRVQLDVEADGDAQSLLRELDRVSGGDRSPMSVAAFLQNRPGVRVTAWRAPDYPGYGTTSR